MTFDPTWLERAGGRGSRPIAPAQQSTVHLTCHVLLGRRGTASGQHFLTPKCPAEFYSDDVALWHDACLARTQI